MKVVAVDDSKQFQRSLTRLLSTVGGVAIVGYAVDVDSAHKLIDDTEPHVVVLDIELRGGARGIDVLRYVAREHPPMKVVVLSNLNWPALRRTYLEAGAEAYSTNPWNLSRLEIGSPPVRVPLPMAPRAAARTPR